MLRKRTVLTNLGKTVVEVSVVQGCPQGGVLSPLLWCMVVDSLLVQLNNAGFPTQGYADDLVIMLNGKHLNVLGELMQNALSIVQKWCISHSLSVNSSKTELIVFTNKRKVDSFRHPAIFGNSVRVVGQVKYLGVILDSKLSWAPHLEAKLNKATKCFWLCRRAFGTTWGLTPKVVRWIYTSIIRPLFSYASLVWWPRVHYESVKKQMGHLQRMACIGITGAMRTTPTAALEVLLSLPPLDLFVEAVAKSTSIRLLLAGRWIGTGTVVAHRRILDKVKSECSLIDMHSDYLNPGFYFNKKFKLIIPPREAWGMRDLPTGDSYVFYTDGSRMNGGSGAGIYLDEPETRLSFPLGSLTTVYQAEVFAITACANCILEMNVRNKNIYICSDSQAALKSISSPLITSQLVLECRNILNSVSEVNSVTLVWVPGHSEVHGNDMADMLARMGSQSEFIGPEPAVGLSVSSVRAHLKDLLFKVHGDRWRDRLDCRQARNFITGPNRRLTNTLMEFDRSTLKRIVGALTGHGPFNKHLFKIGVSASAECVQCGEADESAWHILCECPALSYTRIRLLGSPILSLEHIKTIDMCDIIKFINASKRC